MNLSGWEHFVGQLGPAQRVVLVGPLCERKIKVEAPTVFVDGGLLAKMDTVAEYPTISVGDGDSAPRAVDVLLPVAKDYSDLAFVLRQLPASIREVELIGFLGGRRDHELANFGEVHAFLRARPQGTIAKFDNAVIAFAAGKLSREIHGRFSLLVFERSSLSITGAVQFPLAHPTQLEPLSSHGISNVGHGMIHFHSETPAFLFLNKN